MPVRLCLVVIVTLGLSGCLSGGDRSPAPEGSPSASNLSAYADPPELPPRNPYRGAAARSNLAPSPAPQPATQPASGPARDTPPSAQVRPQYAAPATADGFYRVQSGDTVYGISRRFGVPIRTVIEANDLQPPYTLSINQRLAIPTQRVHVVEAGQTVYGISRIYGVDLTELTRLNEIPEPYTIQVGQRLALPTASGSGRSATAPAASGDQPQSSTIAQGEPEASVEEQVAAIPPPFATGAIPSPPAREGGKFLWPLSGRIISTFGPKDGGLHNDGINIAAAPGTSVYAAENGVVVYAGNELRGFGNLLLVKHADGWVTAYAHNKRLLVGRGQEVRRGQEIAKVGQSGSVTSPQLHFEIRQGSRAINPQEMLGPQRAAN